MALRSRRNRWSKAQGRRILVCLALCCLLFTPSPIEGRPLFEPPASLKLNSSLSAQETAEQLLAEGQRLFATGTSDSLKQALAKFERALELWRAAGDRRAEASTLSFIARTHDLLGEKQRALDYYQRTLAHLEALGDSRRGEAATLNNIGLIHDSLGDKQRALEFYNRALAILQTTDDRRTLAVTLVNIGLAYDQLGEKQQALARYQQALPIFRATGDRASEAVTLNNIGFVYHALGDRRQALGHYQQALPILKAIGDARVEAVTLSNIGYVYHSLDEKQKALEHYQQALPALKRAGDPFKEATTLNNIGLIHHSLKEYEQALDYFAQALKLRQAIGDRPGEAVTLGDTGAVHDALGATEKAVGFYDRSLFLSRAVQDRSTEASTLRRLALVDLKRGRLAEARARMESALSILETLRAKVAGHELRASYFASIQQHFESYINILMRLHKDAPKQGFDALALQASERARARSLLEMLAEARADIRQGVRPELVARERALQQRLAALAERQTRLLGERQPEASLVAALKAELEKVLGEYQGVEAEIRASSPRYAALTQPSPSGLKEIQQQALDADTLLLEYSLGEERSFLWLVTPHSLKSFELPARALIEDAAREAYALLTARNLQVRFETADERRARVERADREFERAAERLSRMLLAPVSGELGGKRLLIVSDGALNYLPFAALPLPSSKSEGAYRPLMLEHEVVALPSASTLIALRRELLGRQPAAKTLAVIADPVFDKMDARVKASQPGAKPQTRGTVGASIPRHHHSAAPHATSQAQTGETGLQSARIQRLPFTRLEADEILSLVPTALSLRALDFEASRATAMSPVLGEYRYVHFATHGVLNSEYPELSGLALSLIDRDGREQEGFLWSHEVYNLRLPVELVVLSGCRTGLGKEIRGEGLVGLTRGFMYAGAARVVVSLWDISDEASAQLMTELYKGMLGKERLRPAAALRAAQLTVWRERRWQAPYYWAAFVLQGEVR